MSVPTAETWIPIPGLPLYEVSDHGRVRRQAKTVLFVDGRTRTWPLQILGQFKWGDNPHYLVNINTGDVRGRRSVHELVLLSFVGPRPVGVGGEEIRHLDGDPHNNKLDNLVYGSRSENARDRVRHGTHYEAAKTHCKHGHEFTAENTVFRRDHHQRLCLACRKNNNARSAERQRNRSAPVH